MTNEDINEKLISAKSSMKELQATFESVVIYIEKIKNMELENADIKQDIDDMINDMLSKLNNMINEINSVS